MGFKRCRNPTCKLLLHFKEAELMVFKNDNLKNLRFRNLGQSIQIDSSTENWEATVDPNSQYTLDK
jgi:hypothetical protein